MTKICIFGAGAIGGYVGARLVMKGEADVSLVARGANLAAMKADEAIGVNFAVGADERVGMASKVGAHRTSMLQDVEAGRPTELDAMLGVVIEIAKIVNVSTPSLQLIYDLVKFRSQNEPAH